MPQPSADDDTRADGVRERDFAVPQMLEVRLSIGDDGEVTLTQTLTLVLPSAVGQPWTASSLLVSERQTPAPLNSAADYCC